jgi:RES domain-containing protein
MIPHPDFNKILRSLRHCPLESIDQIVFRSVASTYVDSIKLLTGNGSIKQGGRWNTIGSFRVIYTSFDDHTALEESKAKFKAYGFSGPKVESRKIVPLHVRLARVIKIESIAPILGVTVQSIITHDWRTIQDGGHESFTQAIGRVSYQLKIQAIRCPSDRFANGINLTLIRKHVIVPRHVEIIDL